MYIVYDLNEYMHIHVDISYNLGEARILLALTLVHIEFLLL